MVAPSSPMPLLRTKQTELDVQDLYGLLQIQLQIGGVKLRSALYTRVDRALLLQAYLWSAPTAVGAIATLALTLFWAGVERAALFQSAVVLNQQRSLLY